MIEQTPAELAEENAELRRENRQLTAHIQRMHTLIVRAGEHIALLKEDRLGPRVCDREIGEQKDRTRSGSDWGSAG